MAFLDNSGDIILDAVLTDTGRHRLARGDGSFRIAKFALGDDEINYTLYDKTNLSGSAYYDLSILQTPVLEAFTNNTSLMKSKLISIPRTNLLYLPTIVQNNKISSAKPFQTLGDNTSYLILVDDDTQATYTNGANGVLLGNKPDTQNSNFIRVDQGLNTTEIPVSFALDADLVETQYIVEIDNRLGQIASAANGGSANVSFIDDDQIASYYFSLNTDSDYVKIPQGAQESTGLGTDNQISGPRGTILELRIKASIDLNSSTFLFTQLGDTVASTDVALGTTATYYYIDSTVRISGATTGYRIDLPIRFLKKV
jgi:hypothetical protein